MSDGLETYSPVLDRDLEDLAVARSGRPRPGRRAMAECARPDQRSAMAFAASQAQAGGHARRRAHRQPGRLSRAQTRPSRTPSSCRSTRISTCGPTTKASRSPHATWLNHVGQEFGFPIVHQVGLRSGDRARVGDRARAQTAWSSTELSLPPAVRAAIGQRPVYVSIDIDVLDPAHAPGTGCPSRAA